MKQKRDLFRKKRQTEERGGGGEFRGGKKRTRAPGARKPGEGKGTGGKYILETEGQKREEKLRRGLSQGRKSLLNGETNCQTKQEKEKGNKD